MRKAAFKINSYCDEKPAQWRSYTICIVINTPKSKVVVRRCCDNSAAPFLVSFLFDSFKILIGPFVTQFFGL